MATEWQPVPAPGDEVPAPEQPSVPQQPAAGARPSRASQAPGIPHQAGDRVDAYEPSPPPSYRPAEEPPARRLASHPVVGFIPWILFWVIGGPSTWETATIAALIAALLVMALSLDLQPLVAWSTAQSGSAEPGPAGAGPARPSRFRAEVTHLKLLDVATVVFFAALTIAAIVTSRHDVAELPLRSGVVGRWPAWVIIFSNSSFPKRCKTFSGPSADEMSGPFSFFPTIHTSRGN